MKILVSTFTKFYKSISSQWLAAILAVFVLAAVMPRVGKLWTNDTALLWVVFFPMLLLRNLATAVAIPADKGMLVLVLLGTPLVVLYWSCLFWGVNKTLRLVAGNHLGR